MTTGVATLKRLVLSNGLPGATTMAYAPYSSNGQAFATTATGATGSTNTPGGPRRTFYQQFTITNSGTAALRVDSLIFTAATGSSANGRFALAYSTNGFTTDSLDFAGGKGPTGVLPATANGSFGAATSSQPAAAPGVLPQFSATAPSAASTFRMAFVSGGTGLSVAAGRTLSVRMYFRVGSDTEGRYFVMRNVILKSTQTVLATRARAGASLAAYPNPVGSQLRVPHPAAGRAAHVALYTIIGTRLATLPVAAGTTQTTLHTDSLAKGLYLVEYTDGNQRLLARIVKE